MNCYYCGLVTGRVARWEVSTGEPGAGMTRYVCDAHLAAAYRHVAQVGEVSVSATNSAYYARRDAA